MRLTSARCPLCLCVFLVNGTLHDVLALGFAPRRTPDTHSNFFAHKTKIPRHVPSLTCLGTKVASAGSVNPFLADLWAKKSCCTPCRPMSELVVTLSTRRQHTSETRDSESHLASRSPCKGFRQYNTRMSPSSQPVDCKDHVSSTHETEEEK